VGIARREATQRGTRLSSPGAPAPRACRPIDAGALCPSRIPSARRRSRRRATGGGRRDGRWEAGGVQPVIAPNAGSRQSSPAHLRHGVGGDDGPLFCAINWHGQLCGTPGSFSARRASHPPADQKQALFSELENAQAPRQSPHVPLPRVRGASASTTARPVAVAAPRPLWWPLYDPRRGVQAARRRPRLTRANIGRYPRVVPALIIPAPPSAPRASPSHAGGTGPPCATPAAGAPE
jgi:hypothetical protein